MSNEELAVAIQAGERDKLPELWKQVKDFISMQAGKYARASNGYGGVTQEDLTQCGYLALVTAVNTFSPDKGNFISWLAMALKTAFREATGHRTSKRDPLDMAISLDTPLDGEDGNTETIGDMQEDHTAAQGFEEAQQRIWLEQLHSALEMALQQLPEDEYTVIRARYYEGRTRREIGPKARQIEERALKYLRRPYVQQWLREFVEERTPYFLHVGVTSFKSSGISAVEKIVFERGRLQDQWVGSMSEKSRLRDERRKRHESLR